ncbi:hypothetical protein IAT38_008133 [Cryptococcus sp. DSM 104549]
MQQQHRQSGPSYHPPADPNIPVASINTLIPRLTSTINDIDSLKALLGNGAQDGTLPSWDVILQRYSLLLGRINALSSSLTTPPPRLPNTSGALNPPPASIPLLSQFLVHPLNPLPDPSAPGSDVSPLAQDTFFQVINTLPLPAAGSSGGEAATASGSEGRSSAPAPGAAKLTSRAGGKSYSKDELRGMSEAELEGLRRRLRGRLERERRRAGAMREEVRRHADEVEWTMRIGEGDDDEDDEEEAGGAGASEKKGKGEKEEDDDDLFGSDEDEPMEETAPAEAAPKAVAKEKEVAWTLDDYKKYLDTGARPS